MTPGPTFFDVEGMSCTARWALVEPAHQLTCTAKCQWEACCMLHELHASLCDNCWITCVAHGTCQRPATSQRMSTRTRIWKECRLLSVWSRYCGQLRRERRCWGKSRWSSTKRPWWSMGRLLVNCCWSFIEKEQAASWQALHFLPNDHRLPRAQPS